MGRNKNTNERVAIKILKKKGMKPEISELYRNEIESLKLCQHENIVKLYDVIEDTTHIFIVMELLECGTLSDYIRNNKLRMQQNEAKKIIKGIAQALEYLKLFGIVHRDLKPNNILMTNDNIPKLADFGLATIVGPTQKCNEYVGTASFACPEAIIGIPYSFEADIWSFGILAYTILCGALPFVESKENILNQ